MMTTLHIVMLLIVWAMFSNEHKEPWDDTKEKEAIMATKQKNDVLAQSYDEFDALDEGQLKKIKITDVVLHGSKGGHYTDNMFMCSVYSCDDCELWLEVRKCRDNHQFSKTKDANTRSTIIANSDGTNSTYKARIVTDGGGRYVPAFVTLWGKPVYNETASILFQTNAVWGTWRG